MKVATVDQHHAAAQRGRQQRLQLLYIFGVEFIWLVRQEHEVRAQLQRLVERRTRVTLTRSRINVVEAEHPQHVMSVSIAVEGDPWIFPDRTEHAKAQLAPRPETGFDLDH